MSNPSLLNVYDLKPVYNVCNQILREIISLSNVSLAHVIMKPNDVSLLHKHSNMNEIYYILEGNGILYYDKNALNVEDNAYLIIEKNSPHKLRNTGNSILEHLVFATPPFDASDVVLLENEQWEPHPKIFKNKRTPTVALDGASVLELFSKEEQNKLGIEIAIGKLPPKRKAISHFHERSEEFYYIIGGEGKVRFKMKEEKIKKGCLVYLPTDTIHGLENTSATEELEVLCLSTPPYTDSDFIRY